MGQYWRLVDLDAGWFLSHGKLVEFFFDGHSNPIHYQRGLLPRDDSGLLYIDRKISSFLLTLLKPVKIPEDWSRSATFAPQAEEIRGAFNRMPDNSLSVLPNEIHSKIYDELDYTETIYLSLTCRHFFSLAQPRLCHLATNYLSEQQSAGNRLVCVGDYTDNIPASLLPAREARSCVCECEECVFLDGTRNESRRPLSESGVGRDARAEESILFSLWSYAGSHFSPTEKFCGADAYKIKNEGCISDTYTSEVYKAFTLQTSSSRDEDLAKMASRHPAWSEIERWEPSNLLKFLKDQYLSLPSSKCTLRNLTSHEYVINSGICLGTAAGPLVHGEIGFAEVLYAQICFSNDPSISMPSMSMELDGESLHQGPWAGHRFDITTLDDINQERKTGIKWHDVTLKMRKKLKVVFEMLGGEYSLEPPSHMYNRAAAEEASPEDE